MNCSICDHDEFKKELCDRCAKEIWICKRCYTTHTPEGEDQEPEGYICLKCGKPVVVDAYGILCKTCKVCFALTEKEFELAGFSGPDPRQKSEDQEPDSEYERSLKGMLNIITQDQEPGKEHKCFWSAHSTVNLKTGEEGKAHSPCMICGSLPEPKQLEDQEPEQTAPAKDRKASTTK